jgi:CubicO group peptidase (beta-lactamase class C family)
MKSILKITALFWVMTFVLIGCAKSKEDTPSLNFSEEETLTEKITKADSWIQQLHDEKKFNGGVLLIQNDSILLKNMYGFTDHTLSEKLNSQSAFRLASVSKQFTAVGIMLLKEQGKLDFDDGITQYLSELPYQNVSIRNLLNHTSGIPDAYMDFPKNYRDEIGSELSILEVVELLAKSDMPLQEEPNTTFRYNNTGYVLLAAIIERVSNVSFEEFMQKELFDPLEMKDSRVWNLVTTNPDFNNKTSSFQYSGEATKELKPGVLDGLSGDGGVFVSLDDFVLWNQFWNDNDLLSRETMEEAFVKPKLSNGKESNYAFGWVVLDDGKVWHNGSWLGARTLIVRNKNPHYTMVVLDNLSSQHIDVMGQELAKLFE